MSEAVSWREWAKAQPDAARDLLAVLRSEIAEGLDVEAADYLDWVISEIEEALS